MKNNLVKIKVCTSIKPKRIEQVEKLVRLALDKGSDLVEVRLDYIEEMNIERLAKALKDSTRCIFTCRPSWEGGSFKGSEEERLRLLSSLAELKPAYLDIELRAARLDERWKKLLNSSNIIFSYHDFDATSELQVLVRIWEEARGLGGLVKIVTFAKKIQDNIKVLSLYKTAEPKRLIAFCMGSKGILSRVLCPFFGSPFTYASLGGAKTAAGQLGIDALKELYRMVEGAFEGEG